MATFLSAFNKGSLNAALAELVGTFYDYVEFAGIVTAMAAATS